MTQKQSIIIEQLKKELDESKEEQRKLKLNLQNQNEIIRKNNKRILRKDNLISELKSLWNPDVLERGGPVEFMHAQNNLENIIRSNSKLMLTISKTRDEFDDICYKVAAMSHGDARMFYEDGSPASGNRSKLSRDQTVYLAILAKKGGERQVELGMLFGVNQSTISRSVAYVDAILLEVLPTAAKFSECIRHATQSTLDRYVPENCVMVDGTEVTIDRPQDKDLQKEYYSGKKKRHTVKHTVLINAVGMIIYIGPPHSGRTHDLKMLKLDDPDLGLVTKRMKSEHTRKQNKMTNYSDLGYVGIRKIYPGADNKQPEKKPRGGELTVTQKEHNRKISRVRIKVENSIGRLKHYGVLGKRYVSSDERLCNDMQIISGLVNHHMLWNSKKKKLNLGF